MVLLHFSHGVEEFYYETTGATPVAQVQREVIELHNTRLRVKRLAHGVKQLALYGPMRPEADRGLTDEQLNASGKSMAVKSTDDPLGIRVGVPCDAKLQAVLNQTADAMEQLCATQLAKLRKPLVLAPILEAIQTVRGAVMMAFPMNLPEFDTVRQGLENDEDLSGQEDSKHVLELDSSTMWFAGKALEKEQLLSKYTGKNEKVTLKVKITKSSSGAPQREPAVDDDTRKKMMSFWHKKEQEQKALEQADEDSYLNSAWADPKGFKSAMNGLASNVMYRPGQRF